ncbi:ABC transporter ATP-binding protein [Dechloromonas denitrificans]|uniref:ABC transporter ATP-binding protein n=1 Tax=Dechloromonas denitrificans TaxID=281362 RepID=UPI001CF980DD|nr:ABC transporter ATP-binding protein [Dechloromonas denitrificans]UCV06687.1 ABC transporter ATP-binding protein [Dechloromonas denitrificans]
MIDTLAKIRSLLTAAERRAAVVLFGLMLIGMVLETLGVGLVVPVIALILQGDLLALHPALVVHLGSLGSMSQRELIVVAMLGLVGAYFLKNAFLAFLIGKQTHFAYNVQEKLSQRLFTIYLRQPYTFHLQRNSAELVRNITGEVGILTGVLTSGLLMLTELLVTAGVACLLLLVEPVGALLAVLVFCGSAWVFNRLTRERITRWGIERQIHDGLRLQHLQQGLGGAKDVKLLGRESEFLAQFQTHNAKSTRIWRLLATLQSYPRLMFEMLAVSGLAVLVLSMLAQQRDLSSIVPTLGLFAAAAFRLMPSVNRILTAVQNLRYTLPVVASLHRESQLPAPDLKAAVVTNRPPFGNVLTISELVYQYPGASRLALEGVSISIRRGESVGLIGASGSGKSTLVDVILGLLEPGGGVVQVDGDDIQQCLRYWQDQIGYVPQSIYLTDDTLRRNVAFGLRDDEIDEAAVQRAIESAQLDTFVNSLPEGLRTIVGERGVRLSGGQRQRIGIARALYHDPAVLVLDEATSALDTATESSVMEAVSALHGSKTIIIVAHRLSTVEKCDRLIRLEAGHVVAEGPPAVMLQAEPPSALIE